MSNVVQQSKAVCNTLLHPPVPAGRVGTVVKVTQTEAHAQVKVKAQVVLLVVKADTRDKIWH